MKITVEEALNTLHANPAATFVTLFRHGSMSVEIYEPQGQDFQQPHTQDEIYVVVEGEGLFRNGAVIHPFQKGDLLFVPAGVEHRFEAFSENFKTWVIFYGPQGGEP